MEFLSTISPSKYDLFFFFKVIPSTGSKLKRPTPAFHSSRTSLAGDTSNSSSPASTGARTNRAGKGLPQLFCTGRRGEGMARLGIWKQQAPRSASLLPEEQRCRETQVRCPEDSWLKPCLPRAGAPTAQATAPVRHQKRLYGGECERGKGPPRAGPS